VTMRQIRTSSGQQFLQHNFEDPEYGWQDLDEEHPLANFSDGVTTIFCSSLAFIQLREKPEEV
jgi:hypothetical protein